ncbi:MAG: DNA gyrase subunit A [Sodaliphilus pleomorphus]|jgi:DNA gyrase subunit A|uniref:DNA gyrase subunit A n=1 Tax=Sodaliphilus pleomorphus TaxID=2606626 RepID=UPI0023F36B7E|nr:DNA gyrase subunit A [Sodaliphilus pleomorphus]MCI5980244.1 DNA gyrase subunit A [Muribaculaceae bacterium]MDY6252727.1 DNA gyrase subunit A [Bacteroidales bacterium]MCI6168693.1 DNA gyrase subunit A [Muribaculaceae bacterium]MDD7066464.1 DNA gyrase subunit A [Sodaliphilus pleomorphus]MDY2832646.1 DNA gyrase subunit A [Sodaliphilus pleomorphus]
MNSDRIIEINIDKEMRTSYIDYSMSVIVSRALPDVRDGFKPVHRRVLFGMEKLGNFSNAPYKKSARIVGDVLGKYHPHGDSSVYFAMVRLAQDWAMRYPLVDGQGNFGSIDGDSPAAMRYTEARLAKMGEEMMRDLDEDTVDFEPNFDNTLEEPVVLPTRFPNLLVNGASGIAVGMATNMPPHNLTESINGCLAMLENPDITIPELMHYIKAPDFPTGGIIYGYQGVKDAFETGRGRIVVRAKAEIETENDRDKIVVTEIPYNVNKRELIEAIARLVEEKRIDGISNINDESDRQGMRIVIDVKKDQNANVLLNKLYKMSELQSSFSVNNVCLVNGRPETVNLKQLIQHFLDHRHEVVIRRSKFELKKAQDRAHILEGLIIASDNIDEVVHIIRSSKTTDEARQRLGERFGLDEVQTRAIVEMRLRQLTNLEQGKLHDELDELMKTIAHLQEILSNPDVCRKVIEDELIEIRDKYGDERRTQIEYSGEEMNAEDFFPDDPMIITISHFGYIKRTPLTEYRTQNRGGVGAKGSDTRDQDFIEYVYEATNHNYMLFFTGLGRCYWLRVFEIPEGSKNSKGRAIQNLLNLGPENRIYAFIRATKLKDPEYNESHNIVFATKNGLVKKTRLSEYSRPRANGVIAINLREDDQLIGAILTEGDSEVILADRNGRAIRFNESTIRTMGRSATGVKGMTLSSADDEIVGMICMRTSADDDVLVVSEQGMGKRSKLEDYRVTNRGGKGVKTMNITEKTGKLIAIKNVNDSNDLVIINKSGIMLRMKVSSLRVMGRNTQGVRLINLEKKNDEIASVCKVQSQPESEETDLATNQGESLDNSSEEIQNDNTTNEQQDNK